MATETKETSGLIGSDKVEGTAVYGSDGNKIGSIERIMVGKRDGRVSYAVLSFGGFLGMGDEHYPLPWNQLKYDTRLGGYLVNLTEDQLKGAPSTAAIRGTGKIATGLVRSQTIMGVLGWTTESWPGVKRRALFSNECISDRGRQ